MTRDPSVEQMWKLFTETRRKEEELPSPYRFVFRFGDAKELCEVLTNLVLERKKCGTAYSPWFFEHDGLPVPQAGDYSIVTDWEGAARCIIQTLETNIIPFNEVKEEFARMEGEGDLSLSYWRKAHEAYFTRECQRTSHVFSYQMPVFCEVFRVVYE
ncbi:ASCH domain-containing protein [Cohnella sp. JJ-181]|uniref:ASCH domain-containing protein n=1 Tax=Cohnella rhizoplanae TaxID=2974897 RepID=UPI00232DF583|nr:ASCH domain-containing protein [Cohnella sp. JJ-181]